MNAQGTSPVSESAQGPPFPRGKLGGLDADVAAAVVAAGGDIAMVIDRQGVILDMAISSAQMEGDGARSWLDRRWIDTVSQDSRHKVEALLRDALKEGQTQWREINQVTPSLTSMMVRYVAVDAGHDSHVIVIGRDDRAASLAQNRLVEAQQAMERDYSRLRDADSRFRLLFQMTGEAVVIVDMATKRIIEANPGSEFFIGEDRTRFVNEPFAKVFDPQSQDDAASLLTLVQTATAANCSQMRLLSGGREFLASASLFRQDRATHALVRLVPVDQDRSAPRDSGQRLQAVLERLPDAFVVTDADLKILSANVAFLDLVRAPTKGQVLDQTLGQFLGRAGLDRNILVDTLREHGSVRNFATVLRDRYEGQEDVEVTAASVADGPDSGFGFTIRALPRRAADGPQGPAELRRSVEQLTEIVGRVKLKDLVRETTDLVEKMCIEAALELTKDNRASAAEVLGLSRQSLYSKLHRFGLGNLTDNDN